MKNIIDHMMKVIRGCEISTTGSITGYGTAGEVSELYILENYVNVGSLILDFFINYN